MKHQLSLSIKKPCSEDFNSFTPTNNGGFCNACEKEVIDFTKMNPQQIVDYFKNNFSNNTCGRFKRNQLEIPKNHIPRKKAALVGVGMALLTLTVTQTISAQSNANNSPSTESILQTSQFTISGNVSDESGPLPGVTILKKGSTLGVETDFDGNFTFPTPLKKGDVLIASFIGMETQKITINNSQKPLKIIMKPDAILLGEVIMVGEVAVKKPFTSKKKKN